MKPSVTSAIYKELLSDIKSVQADRLLFEDGNFNLRIEAIDFLEFHVLDRLQSISPPLLKPEQLNSLKQKAIEIKSELEKVNTLAYDKLRKDISQQNYPVNFLLDLIKDQFDVPNQPIYIDNDMGYDNLDVFINGLLDSQNLPDETRDREPEMVFYQKTPARVIFEVINRAKLQTGDVFFDVGSGLGQVNILVNLFSGVVSKGIEFEPAFFSYSVACVKSLNLKEVIFINEDARDADYSSGTTFFFFTPFTGRMLDIVLEKLKMDTINKNIQVFSFGPCTKQIAAHAWLKSLTSNNTNTLGHFVTSDR